MKYLPYDEAKEFVQSLKIKSQNEWKAYCKSGKKPANIPYHPDRQYSEWIGLGDWLGTGRIADQLRKYRSFEEAKNFVKKLNLNSEREWMLYVRSGKKPPDIPAVPSSTYSEQWKGMGLLSKYIVTNYFYI